MKKTLCHLSSPPPCFSGRDGDVRTATAEGPQAVAARRQAGQGEQASLRHHQPRHGAALETRQEAAEGAGEREGVWRGGAGRPAREHPALRRKAVCLVWFCCVLVWFCCVLVWFCCVCSVSLPCRLSEAYAVMRVL